MTPATLLACINRMRSCFPAFETTRFFCVNTLAPSHEALSNLFGGKTAMA
nr:flavin reductase family protein [Rhizobium sullae]